MDCNAIGDYLRSNHHTRSTAALSKQLEAAFSCKGSEIRKCINRLRSDGIPICSCVDGYFYSDEPEDISGTINQLHGRIEKNRTGVTRYGQVYFAGEEDVKCREKLT